MKLIEILSLVFVSLVSVAIMSTPTIAGERLIVVTQPEHVQIVRRLVGPQVEVKLLLPAGITSNAFQAINAHVRALGTPEVLLIDLRQDDRLRRLWCERLVNSTGTMAIELPRGLLGGAKEARRSIGDFVALREFAHHLSDRLPSQRVEILKNLKVLATQLSQTPEGTSLVSLGEPPAQSAP
jgi:hypothetical protein